MRTRLNHFGWLLCDGSSNAISAYPDLYQAFGTANGGEKTSPRIPRTLRRTVELRTFPQVRGLQRLMQICLGQLPKSRTKKSP